MIIYDDPEHVFMLCSDVVVFVFVFVFGQRYVLFVSQFMLNICPCLGSGVRCQPWNKPFKFRIQDPGSRILYTGSLIQDLGSWIHDPIRGPWFQIQDPRSRVLDPEPWI